MILFEIINPRYRFQKSTKGEIYTSSKTYEITKNKIIPRRRFSDLKIKPSVLTVDHNFGDRAGNKVKYVYLTYSSLCGKIQILRILSPFENFFECSEIFRRRRP